MYVKCRVQNIREGHKRKYIYKKTGYVLVKCHSASVLISTIPILLCHMPHTYNARSCGVYGAILKQLVWYFILGAQKFGFHHDLWLY